MKLQGYLVFGFSAIFSHLDINLLSKQQKPATSKNARAGAKTVEPLILSQLVFRNALYFNEGDVGGLKTGC